MIKIQYLVLILAAIQCGTDSHRILAVYPFPSRSHHYVFNVLTNELAKRGHELVVITSHPQKNNHPNITEIEVKEVIEVWSEMLKSKPVQALVKRGVKFTADMITSDSTAIVSAVTDAVLSKTEVINLISDKNQKFDLIIAEAIYNFPLILSEIFNAPFIWFASFAGVVNNYKAIGAPVSHPFLYPNIYRNKINNLSLIDKLYELYIEARLLYFEQMWDEAEEHLLKKHFGENVPSLIELKNKVDMMFVTANSEFIGNRPVPPSVIHLGGLHLKPIQKLSEDLKEFLENSKLGVVYVSFGTNVIPSAMDTDLLESFLQAFEILPYDILMKYDGDLPRQPTNVRIAKWWPQRDLLNHRNIKAFVTQAGLQSTDEAIDSGVPLVGIPMLAEQSFNAERYVQLGIGVHIDVTFMTTEDLINAVRKVVEEKSYKENILLLRDRIRDQPQSPLERAVWWTEHVLRHRGARHLRSPQANISWKDYLIIDVLLVLLIGFVTICFCARMLCLFVLRSVFRRKVKVN